MVFISPMTEAVWIVFPLFSALSLYKGWEKKHPVSRVFKWVIYLGIVAVLGMGIIVFNYIWLPIFVTGFMLLSLFFLYRKYITLNLPFIGALTGALIYLFSYGHLIVNTVVLPFKNEKGLTILSYNLYSKSSKQKRDFLSVIIKKYHPDIICLQEVNAGDHSLFKEAFQKDYPFQLYPDERGNRYQGGIVLSKKPFVTAKNIVIYNRYKDSDLSMNFVRIKISEKKILSLYNLHLISNGFALRTSFSTRRLLNGVVEQERINYIKRLDEAKNTVAKIDFSDDRIVLTGDFNDIMNSRVLSYFEKYFQNAWYQAGIRQHVTFGYRYIGKVYGVLGIPEHYAFNLVGIDHVFVSEGIEVVKYKVLDDTYSDHSPILAQIIIK